MLLSWLLSPNCVGPLLSVLEKLCIFASIFKYMLFKSLRQSSYILVYKVPCIFTPCYVAIMNEVSMHVLLFDITCILLRYFHYFKISVNCYLMLVFTEIYPSNNCHNVNYLEVVYAFKLIIAIPSKLSSIICVLM